MRRPAEEPGSRKEGWSPKTESGLQACYHEAPLRGASSFRVELVTEMSRDRYVAVLGEAKSRGFEFVRFQDFLPGAPALPGRFVALRHDVDFAPSYSLEMAELEHEAGVASTFFVLVDGHFYNALDDEVIGQIRRIHSLGHEVGLHFSAGDDVALRLRLLSELVDAPVCSFAQHDPANAGFADIELPGRVDAYRVIRDHDLVYVSESAKMWRVHTFETALEEDRNLCLSAHPHSWLHPEDDYFAMIKDFRSRRMHEVTGRFDAFIDALAGYFESRLAERP